MTNKVLDDIQSKIDEIVATEKAKNQDFVSLYNNAQDKYAKANERLLEAGEEDDPTAYINAQDEFKTAQALVNFYAEKNKNIQDKPYISEEQYNDFKNKITAEADRVNAKVKKRAIELFEEMDKLKEELQPVVSQADTMLRTLQISIYKRTFETARLEVKGTGKPLQWEEAKYKDWETYNALNNALNTYLVGKLLEEGNE
jgi:hypothetical protein